MPTARFQDGRPGRFRCLATVDTSKLEAYGQVEEPEGPNRSRISRSLADARREAEGKKAWKDKVQKLWPTSRGSNAEAEKLARQRLSEAITVRDERRYALEALETAVGRAIGLRDKAQSDLDDATAARSRAALISAKALMEPVLAGAHAYAPEPLPVYLAQEQLDTCNEAVRLLSAESDCGRTAVAAAESDVKRRASGVIDAQVQVLAERLVRHQEDVARLRHMILGLSYVWLSVGDVSGPWRLSEAVRKALDWTEPYYVPGADPVCGATASWRAYHEALCEDPTAGMEPPEAGEGEASAT